MSDRKPEHVPPCPLLWEYRCCIHPDGAGHRGICTYSPPPGAILHPEATRRINLRIARDLYQIDQAEARAKGAA